MLEELTRRDITQVENSVLQIQLILVIFGTLVFLRRFFAAGPTFNLHLYLLRVVRRSTANYFELMHVLMVHDNLILHEVVPAVVLVEVQEGLAVRLHQARSNFMHGSISIARPRVTLHTLHFCSAYSTVTCSPLPTAP